MTICTGTRVRPRAMVPGPRRVTALVVISGEEMSQRDGGASRSVAGGWLACGFWPRASFEDDDLASDDVAATQGFQVLVDIFELDFGDVVFAEAGFGEGEHLAEVQLVAPEGTEVGQ